MSVTELSHPLAKHIIAELRDTRTNPNRYRILTARITTMLAIEATKELETLTATVQTPLEVCEAIQLKECIGAVPILRAGLAMLQPITELFDEVHIGYVGLERNHTTAIARSYYSKLPDFHGKTVLCLDPMLATGGSASQCISLIKAHGAKNVIMLSIISAPEGIRHVQENHPDVKIITAQIDRALNKDKYILPGLGDFGDRLYGPGEA